MLLMYEDIPSDCHEMLKCGDKKAKGGNHDEYDAILLLYIHTVERL